MKRWALTILFLAGLAGATPAAAADDVLQEITVNPGDTMWAIANKFLKDPQRWPEIVKYNKLPTSDPTIALPGTKIKVPVLLIKEEFRNAHLVRMTPEVRYKRKAETEWHEAKPDMTLGYEDSLRTMKGGEARVRFPTREEVQINENSLVVLKPEKILQEVQILQGDIRASRAKVIMPSGTLVKPRGASSDYHAKVREDKSEVVFVYKGEVDVTAQGKTVRVPEGYGTHVPAKKPPETPVPLAEFKDFDPGELMLQPPASGMDSPKAAATPRRAAAAPKAAPRSRAMVSENLMVSYKVQLAKDPKFEQVVLEKVETIGQAFDVKKQNLPDGSYVMRIAFIDAFGVAGQWSVPKSVIKDTIPPKIANLTPADNQRFVGEESYCDVIGTVEDAAIVTINNDLVFLSPTGRFSRFINLKEGPNKIRIVARDTHGNETVVERTIEYLPTAQQTR